MKRSENLHIVFVFLLRLAACFPITGLVYLSAVSPAEALLYPGAAARGGGYSGYALNAPFYWTMNPALPGGRHEAGVLNAASSARQLPSADNPSGISHRATAPLWLYYQKPGFGALRAGASAQLPATASAKSTVNSYYLSGSAAISSGSSAGLALTAAADGLGAGTGVHLSWRHAFDTRKQIWGVFGFYDLSVAAGQQVEFSDSHLHSVSRLGTAFAFLKHRWFSLNLAVDAAVSGFFGKVPVFQGFHLSVLDSLYLQYGFMAQDFFETQRRTYGGGLSFKTGGLKTSLFASFNADRHPGKSWFTRNGGAVGFSAALLFDRLSTVGRPALAGLTRTYSEEDGELLTPNNDGLHEEVTIHLASNQYRYVRDWRLCVKDSDKRIVDEVYPSLFTRSAAGLFAFPGQVSWDGRQAPGKPFPDGKYSLELEVITRDGRHVSLPAGTASLDATVPRINLFTENPVSSSDVMVVKVQNHSTDTAGSTLTVTDPAGRVLFERELKLQTGKNTLLIPDSTRGEYLDHRVSFDVTLTTKDHHQNSSTRSIRGLLLTPGRKGRAFLHFERPAFSPDNNGRRDRLPISIMNAERRDLKSWHFRLVSLQDSHTSFIKGDSRLPERFEWDGRTDSGRLLTDGTYRAVLEMFYKDSRRYSTASARFMVDTTAPDVSLDIHPPDGFTPDGDGRDDVLYMKPRITDTTPVVMYRLEISDGQRILSRQTGKRLPAVFTYNGQSSSTEPIPLNSFRRYTATLSVFDLAGNRAESGPCHFTTGAIFHEYRERSEKKTLFASRRHIISLPNITFAPGSHTLNSQARDILHRLLGRLTEAPRLQLAVNGHTDDRGSSSMNMQLSKKRADSVADYLREKGAVEAWRISSKGYGMSRPVVPNSSDLNRAANRRVEIEVY